MMIFACYLARVTGCALAAWPVNTIAKLAGASEEGRERVTAAIYVITVLYALIDWFRLVW